MQTIKCASQYMAYFHIENYNKKFSTNKKSVKTLIEARIHMFESALPTFIQLNNFSLELLHQPSIY